MNKDELDLLESILQESHASVLLLSLLEEESRTLIVFFDDPEQRHKFPSDLISAGLS